MTDQVELTGRKAYPNSAFLWTVPPRSPGTRGQTLQSRTHTHLTGQRKGSKAGPGARAGRWIHKRQEGKAQQHLRQFEVGDDGKARHGQSTGCSMRSEAMPTPEQSSMSQLHSYPHPMGCKSLTQASGAMTEKQKSSKNLYKVHEMSYKEKNIVTKR